MGKRNSSTEGMIGKTVILVTHFIRGEAEQQAFLLARELRRRYGLHTEVWSLSAFEHDLEFVRTFEAVGIPTKVIGFKFPVEAPFRWMRSLQWLREVQRVAWQLRKNGVHILLPLTVWPSVLAGLSYRLAGVQLCLWGEREAGSARVPSPERIAVRQVRHFCANSSAGVAFLENEMGVACERISLIPNGVEVPGGGRTTDWRSRLRLRPGEPLVVKIANVGEPKDHATLLRAWAIVQQNWTGKEKPFLALAGARCHDPAYQECRRIILECGLDASVRFLDSVTEIGQLIGACDLAVFSSRHEGMPNTVLEYMVCGKAVAATDLPGIRDAIGPGASDVVAPPGDPERFAGKILDLLGNRESRMALGEANRVRALTEFTVERMADRYLQVIQENLTAEASWRSGALYPAR